MNPYGRFPRQIVSAFNLALVLLCAACGDGGGGDDGGGDLSFTLDRSSISFDYTEGDSPPPQSVTATARGTYSGTLYVGAIAEGTAIDNTIPATISGVQGTFHISPAANLAPGTRAGRDVDWRLQVARRLCGGRDGARHIRTDRSTQAATHARYSESAFSQRAGRCAPRPGI